MMKRILRTVFAAVLCLALLLLAAACGGASLDKPANLSINDQLVLSWTAVPNARSYRLEIADAESGERSENTVQRTSYDLTQLAEGDYELRLRAVGGSNNDIYSGWSETLDFHRDRESGLLYSLVQGNTAYEVRSVGAASGDLAVEEAYRGKPVVGIGDTAFRGSTKITSVTIPDSVSYIGVSAFYNCANLVSVTIPETVASIGRAAFQQCSNLASVNIPEAVTAIEPHTFAYCRKLVSVDLPESIAEIGENAFNNCSGLTEFVVPDSVRSIGANAFRQATALRKVTFGSGLGSIGSNAFYGCNVLSKLVFSELDGELTLGSYAFALDPALAEVELPEGVKSIGTYCFAGDAALERIEIPASVGSVAQYAFYNTKLYNDQAAGNEDLIYADRWIVDASENFKKTVEEITENTFPEGTVGIADAAFRYIWQVEAKDDEGNVLVDDEGNTLYVPEYVSCENLKRITLPGSLKYVGDYAFYHTPNLQRIIAAKANSLVAVGSYAFALCPMLNNVQFADGLKEIDTRAFFRCTLLDYNDRNPELLIPSSVTRVGENAFYGTALWNDKKITDGVVYAGNWVVGYHIDPTYEGEEIQSIIELREDTVGICDYAFYGDQVLQNITGLNKVTKIGKGAFAYCSALATVNLNRNLRAIEDYTFYKCSSIYSVSFPTMLRSIGKAAFYQCKQLHEADLSETQVSSIGSSAFRECSGMASLDLGLKAETVGKYAFYGCLTLGEVEIPDSVTEMGARAFGNCLSLTSLKIGSGIEKIPDYAFSECRWLRTLEIPSTVKEIGDYAFYKCIRLQSLTLGEGVERIGHYAFYGNERLSHVEIPASVGSIGIYAFKGCTALKSVLLAGTPAMIDENAFHGCPVLTIYGTGEGVGEDWSALWDSSQRPAVWGVELSEDGLYVDSVTVGKTDYPHARFGYAGPGRAGYTFVGWAKTKGAASADFTAAELEYLPAGTKVYSVWQEAPEEDESWKDEYWEWLHELLQMILNGTLG